MAESRLSRSDTTRSAGATQIALWSLVMVAICGGLACLGCGRDTTLHPISGRVTLGGKPYYRLLVYFRPVVGEVDQYNLGVGETDKDGNLTLRSTAGNGLVAGTYRVSFSYLVVPGSDEAVASDLKRDQRQDRPPVEKIPSRYADGGETPVTFEVAAGAENRFEFDVPLENSRSSANENQGR